MSIAVARRGELARRVLAEEFGAPADHFGRCLTPQGQEQLHEDGEAVVIGVDGLSRFDSCAAPRRRARVAFLYPFDGEDPQFRARLMPADVVNRLRLLTTEATEAETRLTIEEAAREIQILREQNVALRDQHPLRQTPHHGEHTLCPALRADRLHPTRQARS
jgi:hypothetical protein